ncbi:unnamed protein product [Eruca vesicaria subsp. sativa]|uniref:Uncharacterized protein n=1 Tax=Eruca vesicaria subsp. sativa TaxID=29727 RepID=A0ABC8KK54_ERUVS|nr:unnamed protein product [Eruca vesicaria subsp. sativa]
MNFVLYIQRMLRLHEENIKASVVLLETHVEDGNYPFLELSSRDTLTVSRTMKSFLNKNNAGITAGGANGYLYKEADKSCKVILGALPWKLQQPHRCMHYGFVSDSSSRYCTCSVRSDRVWFSLVEPSRDYPEGL